MIGGHAGVTDAGVLADAHEVEAELAPHGQGGGAHLTALCGPIGEELDAEEMLKRVRMFDHIEHVWVFPKIGTVLVRHSLAIASAGLWAVLVDVVLAEQHWELITLW